MKMTCLALLLILASCDELDSISATDKNNIEKKLTYLKDNRTGLCFAFLTAAGGVDSHTMACVPCDSIPPNLLERAKK